jgi:hypothetical protein
MVDWFHKSSFARHGTSACSCPTRKSGKRFFTQPLSTIFGAIGAGVTDSPNVDFFAHAGPDVCHTRSVSLIFILTTWCQSDTSPTYRTCTCTKASNAVLRQLFQLNPCSLHSCLLDAITRAMGLDPTLLRVRPPRHKLGPCSPDYPGMVILPNHYHGAQCPGLYLHCSFSDLVAKGT